MNVNDPYGQPGGGYQGGGYSGPGYPGGAGYDPQQGYQQQQQGYLQGGPVDFQGAIRQQFQNITNFNGRASRSAYWWYALPLIIIDLIAYIALPSVAYYIIALIVGLSALSLAVRRLHDSDKSGWLLLIGIIPIIGTITVIVFLCLPGTPGPNRHG
jgi:uncharacterized membrane protein YhaH (DUF805 family)